MIKSSDIMKLLKDKNADLSKEELEKIIEEELKKDENEMDTDLIEMCLDTLKEKENAPKKKKFSFIKAASYVAAAAVLVFIISAVIPKLTERNYNNKISEETTTVITEASTKSVTTTKKESPDNIPTETTPAPIYKEKTTVPPTEKKEMSTFSPEESTESVLRKLFKVNGFDDISLPKILFESATILSKNFEENKAEIEIKSNEKNYNITVEKSSEIFSDENSIDVNGLKVSVESENNSSEIRYNKNNLNYRIVFHSDYDEAVRIAKTIC